jgi:hypothetical protein
MPESGLAGAVLNGLDATTLVNYGGGLGNARLGGYNPAPW